MPRPRLILPTLISLLLGALTTTAIAWRLALLDIADVGTSSGQQILPTRGPVVHEFLGGPSNGISTTVYADTGRLVVFSVCYGPEYSGFDGIPLVSGIHESDTPPDQLVPSSLRSHALPWLSGASWPRGGDEEHRLIQASGWPLIALITEQRQTGWFNYEDHFGIKLQGERSMAADFFTRRKFRRTLPLLPLWPNFALNTLIFTALWLPLLLLPTTLRRALRKRRGHCPHCAYDLRATPANSPCPECGNPKL